MLIIDSVCMWTIWFYSRLMKGFKLIVEIKDRLHLMGQSLLPSIHSCDINLTAGCRFEYVIGLRQSRSWENVKEKAIIFQGYIKTLCR